MNSTTPLVDAAVNDTAFEDKNQPHTDWITAYAGREIEAKLNEATTVLEKYRPMVFQIRDALHCGHVDDVVIGVQQLVTKHGDAQGRIATLERELNESHAREAQLKDASADRAIEIAGDQALVNLLSETREAFYESLRREAQLRAALDAPPHDTQHVECVCYSKNPTQVQVGYICNKCKALTLPAPPVVPVKDVKPLVEALQRFTNPTDEGPTLHSIISNALSTFTAKHKI